MYLYIGWTKLVLLVQSEVRVPLLEVPIPQLKRAIRNINAVLSDNTL
jgi:hypothetical protein